VAVVLDAVSPADSELPVESFAPEELLPLDDEPAPESEPELSVALSDESFDPLAELLPEAGVDDDEPRLSFL
jgi:hypothetical protein